MTKEEALKKDSPIWAQFGSVTVSNTLHSRLIAVCKAGTS